MPVENAHRIKVTYLAVNDDIFAHTVQVHFNADRSEQLPWKFTPQQKFVTVLPGETSLAFYRARNESDKDIVGIATYNVTPDRVRVPHMASFAFANSEIDCAVLQQS